MKFGVWPYLLCSLLIAGSVSTLNFEKATPSELVIIRKIDDLLNQLLRNILYYSRGKYGEVPIQSPNSRVDSLVVPQLSTELYPAIPKTTQDPDGPSYVKGMRHPLFPLTSATNVVNKNSGSEDQEGVRPQLQTPIKSPNEDRETSTNDDPFILKPSPQALKLAMEGRNARIAINKQLNRPY